MTRPALHVTHHYAELPGPPVILVHGAPDRSKNFAQVIHRLPDLSVTTYDRRGYGRSVDAAVDGSGHRFGGFEVHARDLIELLEEPSVVVGQSAGGTIAMLASTIAPERFLALGVWEPPMVPYDWWVGDEAMRRTMAWTLYDDMALLGEDMNRSILGDERWDGLRDSTKEMLRGEGAAFHADMACQAEPLFEIDALKVPMVAGHGTDMPPEFVAANRRLAELTNAEMLVGEGVDHFAHLSAPEVWADLVRRTVARSAE